MGTTEPALPKSRQEKIYDQKQEEIMRKRWISMLLALCLCIGMLSTAVSADTYPEGTVIISMNDNGQPDGSGGESEGWTYDGATLTLNAGHNFAIEGDCRVKVDCKGTLLGGSFYEHVYVFGVLKGGVYHGGVTIGLLPSGRGTIEDAEFPLTFELSGAAWADGVTAPETYHYNTGLTLPDASALTGGSGRFDGWYDSYDFAGEPMTEIPAKTIGRRTLYARFVNGPATWPEAGALAVEGTDYALDAAGNCTIYTARGLACLANMVNARDSFTGRTVTLANGIDLLDGGVYGYGASTVISRNSWVPIDDFGGTFDGGGHSISNLYLSVADRDAGLFGNSYGTIRDLEIASGRVSMEKLTKSGFSAGGIAASSSGLIENCVNRADIYANDDDDIAGSHDSLCLGGIVGLAGTSGAGAMVSTVSNCTNYGSVASCGLSTYCPIAAGGIVGYLSGGILGGRSTLLTGCVNRGAVTVPNNTYSAWAGGVAGTVQQQYDSQPASLQNCENSGKVTCGYAAGGMAGYACGKTATTVCNSYNSGAVKGGTDGNEGRAGGVVGVLTYSNALVENCYSRGDISGYGKLGGCVGLASYGKMRNCYSSSAAEPCGSANRDTVTDCTRFTSAAGDHTLDTEVLGTTDLLTALRAWVSAKNDPAYLDWMADKQNENYPIFAKTYTVTVRRGTGGGSYKEGDTVSICADAPSGTEYFNGWTSVDNVSFADRSKAETTFVMPAKNVTVTATFANRDDSDSGGHTTDYYTLYFETDGGTAVRPIRRAEGSRIDLNQTTEREGIIFTGSYQDEECTQSVDHVILNRDMTVYAGWRKDIADPVNSGVSRRLNTDEHIRYLLGYPDGAFGADNNMTRAEAAQMFYGLLLDRSIPITVHFDDVAEAAWYANAVETLASIGVIKGVGDGKFAPERSITRAEFTAIAMRFAELDTSGKNIFSDVPENEWYYDAVIGSIKYGWIGGYPDGTFRPDNTITRAEVTAIVNRMLGRSGDESYILDHADSLTQFNDLTGSHWAYCDIMEAANEHDYAKTNGVERWK